MFHTRPRLRQRLSKLAWCWRGVEVARLVHFRWYKVTFLTCDGGTPRRTLEVSLVRSDRVFRCRRDAEGIRRRRPVCRFVRIAIGAVAGVAVCTVHLNMPIDVKIGTDEPTLIVDHCAVTTCTVITNRMHRRGRDLMAHTAGCWTILCAIPRWRSCQPLSLKRDSVTVDRTLRRFRFVARFDVVH